MKFTRNNCLCLLGCNETIYFINLDYLNNIILEYHLPNNKVKNFIFNYQLMQY